MGLKWDLLRKLGGGEGSSPCEGRSVTVFEEEALVGPSRRKAPRAASARRLRGLALTKRPVSEFGRGTPLGTERCGHIPGMLENAGNVHVPC